MCCLYAFGAESKKNVVGKNKGHLDHGWVARADTPRSDWADHTGKPAYVSSLKLQDAYCTCVYIYTDIIDVHVHVQMCAYEVSYINMTSIHTQSE